RSFAACPQAQPPLRSYTVKTSPNSNSLSWAASSDGRTRRLARPTPMENFSPSAKRAASTVPLRCAAARSGRAGVTRLSAISLLQQRIDRARAIGFAANGAARLGAIDPGGNIQMRPAFGLADKAIEKQRRGDGAGIIVGGIVVQVGHPAGERVLIAAPQ